MGKVQIFIYSGGMNQKGITNPISKKHHFMVKTTETPFIPDFRVDQIDVYNVSMAGYISLWFRI